jgi:hypothetical protein
MPNDQDELAGLKPKPKKVELPPFAVPDYDNQIKRFDCTVHSNREGYDSFELYIADPNDKRRPIRIAGRAGVRIKQGLPFAAVEALRGEYSNKMRTRKPTGEDMGLDAEPYRFHHWNVEVHGEVTNPKPVGKVKEVDADK